MISLSATESRDFLIVEFQLGIREIKVCREVCYGLEGPVMYAQTLTRTSVRQAPANPETRNLI